MASIEIYQDPQELVDGQWTTPLFGAGGPQTSPCLLASTFDKPKPVTT